KHFGFRTINVVRRPEQADELRREGAEYVIASSAESVVERVKQWTGEGVQFGLDAVGGSTGKAAVESLGPGGRMLVYGTLSGEPIGLDPRVLMVGQKSVAGFWLSEWVRTQGALSMLRLFREVQGLMRRGVLTTEIGSTHPLEDFQRALTQAQTSGRKGKVLLRISKG